MRASDCAEVKSRPGCAASRKPTAASSKRPARTAAFDAVVNCENVRADPAAKNAVANVVSESVMSIDSEMETTAAADRTGPFRANDESGPSCGGPRSRSLPSDPRHDRPDRLSARATTGWTDQAP